VEGNANELFDASQTIVELETVNNRFAFTQLEQSNWNNSLLKERTGNPVLKLDKKAIPQLHKDLVALNIELIAMQPKHSLEDYFLRITSANHS